MIVPMLCISAWFILVIVHAVFYAREAELRDLRLWKAMAESNVLYQYQVRELDVQTLKVQTKLDGEAVRRYADEERFTERLRFELLSRIAQGLSPYVEFKVTKPYGVIYDWQRDAVIVEASVRVVKPYNDDNNTFHLGKPDSRDDIRS